MAEKKYKSAAALRASCEEYFRSISRTVTASERVPTGEIDKYGHDIFESRDIFNDDGAPIQYIEYAVPPSITALCIYLGISRETWRRYISTDEKWSAVGTWVKQKIRSFLLHELMTRTKGIRAVEINLERNYSEGEEIVVGSSGGMAELTADQKLAFIHQLSERVKDLEDEEQS